MLKLLLTSPNHTDVRCFRGGKLNIATKLVNIVQKTFPLKFHWWFRFLPPSRHCRFCFFPRTISIFFSHSSISSWKQIMCTRTKKKTKKKRKLCEQQQQMNFVEICLFCYLRFDALVAQHVVQVRQEWL